MEDLKTALAHYIGDIYTSGDYSMFIDEDDMYDELFSDAMYKVRKDIEQFNYDYELEATIEQIDSIKQDDIDWKKVF